MYNKIFILCPAFTVTGGTELLHQLAQLLKDKGQNASVVYTSEYKGSVAESVFGTRYNVNIVSQIEDEKGNIVIAPESDIQKLLKYKKCQRSIWWMSVDNYKGSLKKNYDFKHRLYYKYVIDNIFRSIKSTCIHFVQSRYAYEYLTAQRGVTPSLVKYLSDYLNPVFIETALKTTGQVRDDVVLYNPKKGAAFTKKLIWLSPDLKWVPIQNMTAEQVTDLMLHSKIYVDFGNHPGKDRIPREAAICGCCIITGKRGSAFYNQDVEIPTCYKYDEDQAEQIIEILHECINNYDERINDFDAYRKKIIGERDVFVQEVENAFLK